jgi:D-beta-D-heptose 7-phosphate kinase/D-beta-D-heptose 1-phosphate adenosyltransferase
MKDSLLETVNGLGNTRVLLVGDFMLDSYVYGDAVRISPEAPVPVLKVLSRKNSCGGAASVAVDLEALRAKAICVGVVGNDTNGKELLRLLKEANADTDGILEVNDRPTICKQRLVGLAQHRHRQQLMRIDDESTEPLTGEQYEKLLKNFRSKLTSADIVCIQDYNKGVLNSAICQQIIKESNAAGKRVLVDPPAITDYSKFKGADAITPNRQETSNVVGFEIKDISDAKKAAEKLKKLLGLEAAIITLDRDGAYLMTDTVSQHMPTMARNVYDVTGAGDMVLATIATCLAAGCDYTRSVEIANVAGGLEVEKFGVASVSIAEISYEILRRNKEKDTKLQDVYSLVRRLDWHRNNGEKIVFTNGCFDVIHTGHISYLDFCKQHGDIVVVGLNSDASISRLKGPSRPVNNQHDRTIVLSAMKCVDYICIFDDDTPLNLIMQVKPDVLIKGEDWAEKGVVGREFVEASGGKVVLAPMIAGKSSTSTIEKMKQ